MPISFPEKFLGELEKNISSKDSHFLDFSVENFDSAKSEKCGFFDEKYFSSPPRNFSRANMGMTKVWKMLL